MMSTASLTTLLVLIVIKIANTQAQSIVTTTNKPRVFKIPSDLSSIVFPDQINQPVDPEPEILIGPDEDNMTELQKRQLEDQLVRMCEYYSSMAVKRVLAPPLPLIVGGAVANIREFPHMAVVGWKKHNEAGYSWKCGGTLISDRYVLTAGHCTYQDRDATVLSGPPQAVQLGSSFLDDPGALMVKISAVIRHPKYKMRRNYYDVALIKLVSKVEFSEVIRPACFGTPPPEGGSIIATGYGKTEYGGDYSQELRRVTLDVWNMQECQDVMGRSIRLPNGVTPDSHVCASKRAGGEGTCQGDSGGPAQIKVGNLTRVVAVTSYGRSCAAPDSPTLFAVIPHAFVAAQVFNDRS